MHPQFRLESAVAAPQKVKQDWQPRYFAITWYFSVYV